VAFGTNALAWLYSFVEGVAKGVRRPASGTVVSVCQSGMGSTRLVSRAVAGEKTMRTSFGIIMAIGMWLAASPADAQRYDPRYPVCMHRYGGSFMGADYFDCSFTSLEQCRATASGLAATCDINPYYAGNQPPPPRRRNKPVY
jgi:hypothetical protein